MKILNRLKAAFAHKEETENGQPAEWEPDEVWVRDESGKMVKLEPPEEGESDDADNKA